MKTVKISILSICLSIISCSIINAQEADSLGLPGDNFDLNGVLELFKNAENSEELEKAINSEANEVNNLDLNEDGTIDYVKVMDYQKDNGRALVLQIDINAEESQNVAVIEIDKTGEETATAQIVGDEDLYGENYYVEPKEDEADGSKTKALFGATVVVNVWAWRPLRHYYGPKYVVWVSPWHWAYYPGWFKPWKPVGWHVYHKRVYHYRVHCHRVYVHRAPHIKVVYHPHRKASKTVYAKRTANKTQVKAANKGTNTGSNQRKADNKKAVGAKGGQKQKAKGGGGAKKAGGGGKRAGGGGGGKRGR